MHEAGHDVSLLAQGERLASLRRHGIRLAEEDSPTVRRVPVPVVEHPAGGYDLIAVLVRTHQLDAVLESLTGLEGDVPFLHNWAAGAQPLGAVIGHERVLLGFPTAAGTMDGEVVRYRATTFVTRRVARPIGEPDGRTTGPSRVRRVADPAGRAARGRAAALPAEPDGHAQRAQQRLACGGGRTRATGRTDARLCQGAVGDRRLWLPGRTAPECRRTTPGRPSPQPAAEVRSVLFQAARGERSRPGDSRPSCAPGSRPPYERPQKVCFGAQPPPNASGKVLRPEPLHAA